MRAKISLSAILLSSWVIGYSPFSPAELMFNPKLLESEGQNVDLSIFTSGDAQPPGQYRVRIFANSEYIGARDINFTLNDDKSKLIPCLPPSIIKRLNLNVGLYPGLENHLQDQCFALQELIPDSQIDFDFSTMELRISVPQAAINQNSRGYIDKSEWQNGITALFVNYNFNGSNTWTDSDTGTDQQNDYFLNLQSGFNIGPWRIRDNSNITWPDSGGRDIEHISTYAERDVRSLNGRVRVGDAFTSTDIFDSIQFRGVSFTYDEQMLPESEQGFAPTVRGIANTNAKVVVRQNGYIVYQTYVTPGPFVINDLYATSNGDLDVTIEETDGSTQHFVQPYATVPLLQRAGRFDYSIEAGVSQQDDKTQFLQGTFLYGFNDLITGYTGLQTSDNYNALNLGVGLNLRDFGAISFDVTGSSSEFDNSDFDDTHGVAYRALYSKYLQTTDTNIQVVGYRYASSGSYTFNEVSRINNEGDLLDLSLVQQERSSVDVNINQNFGEYGSFFANVSKRQYWQGSDETLYQFSYNNSFRNITYGITYNYNRIDDIDDAQHSFALTLSMPFDFAGSSSFLSYTFTHDQDGNTLNQQSVSGLIGDDNNLNYSFQQSYGNNDRGYGVGGSLDYKGQFAESNVAYNHDKNSDRLSYGLNGSVVAHSGGITLGQQFFDSAALVQIDDADGVHIVNQQGVETDSNGYALIPYVTPYRRNEIRIDTNTLPNNVDIDDNIAEVIPTSGSIVRTQFKSQVGYRVIMTISKDGVPLPFGTLVNTEDMSSSGQVADAGEVYLSGLPIEGELTAKWGRKASDTCRIKYKLPVTENSANTSIVFANERCE